MKNKQFPKDFIFGTALASYQVEGGIYNNDWTEWENRDNSICAEPLSSSLNVCETPMIHPILHVLTIKILPINVRHVNIIGCRSAQLISYSGNANMKDEMVAKAPAIENSANNTG